MNGPAVIESDSERIMALLATDTPDETALIDAARLLLRYDNHPLMEHLHPQLNHHISRWGHDRTSLFAATRALWSNGWRPPLNPTQQVEGVAVGSGADVVS